VSWPLVGSPFPAPTPNQQKLFAGRGGRESFYHYCFKRLSLIELAGMNRLFFSVWKAFWFFWLFHRLILDDVQPFKWRKDCSWWCGCLARRTHCHCQASIPRESKAVVTMPSPETFTSRSLTGDKHVLITRWKHCTFISTFVKTKNLATTMKAQCKAQQLQAKVNEALLGLSWRRSNTTKAQRASDNALVNITVSFNWCAV